MKTIPTPERDPALPASSGLEVRIRKRFPHV